MKKLGKKTGFWIRFLWIVLAYAILLATAILSQSIWMLFLILVGFFASVYLLYRVTYKVKPKYPIVPPTGQLDIYNRLVIPSSQLSLLNKPHNHLIGVGDGQKMGRLELAYIFIPAASIDSLNSFFVTAIRAFCAKSSLVVKSKASSGHHLTHLGPSFSFSQRSQILTFFNSGCNVMAPYSQASMHQLQPSHLSSSTIMTPFCSDCVKASLGHAVTHGAGLQSLQAMEMLISGCNRMVRILDFWALKTLSLVREHMYSHTVQPVHLSGSQETIFHFALSAFGTVFGTVANFYSSFFSFLLLGFGSSLSLTM